MKKILMLVVALTAVGSVGLEGQDRIEMDDLVQRGMILLHPSTMKPYSGVAYTMHDPNTVKTWVEIVDGKRHGIMETYFSGGQLESRVGLRNNELHGLILQYYDNGQLETKIEMVSGVAHGVIESYQKDGTVWNKGTMNMGKPCGEGIEDGQVKRYPPCPR